MSYGALFGYTFAFGSASLVLFAIYMVVMKALDDTGLSNVNFSNITEVNLVATSTISWIVLVSLSIAASKVVYEILSDSKKRSEEMFRANIIAVIIAGVLAIFVFTQTLLESVFNNIDPSTMVDLILFGGGGAAGWVVWYLRYLKKYGEFFHVFLFSATISLCWYARLSAPEPSQIAVIAFLLASLTRVAFDYLDLAHRKKSNKSN